MTDHSSSRTLHTTLPLSIFCILVNLIYYLVLDNLTNPIFTAPVLPLPSMKIILVSQIDARKYLYIGALISLVFSLGVDGHGINTSSSSSWNFCVFLDWSLPKFDNEVVICQVVAQFEVVFFLLPFCFALYSFSQNCRVYTLLSLHYTTFIR